MAEANPIGASGQWDVKGEDKTFAIRTRTEGEVGRLADGGDVAYSSPGKEAIVCVEKEGKYRRVELLWRVGVDIEVAGDIAAELGR